MRKHLVTIIFLTLSSDALAGLAIFSPPFQTFSPGESVHFDITLRTQFLPHFDSANVIINADVPFTFEYSRAFETEAFMLILVQSPVGLGIKPYDRRIGGLASALGVFGNSIVIGTVIVDTSNIAPGGEYEFLISSEADNGLSEIARRVDSEGIEGRAWMTAVPEPMAWMLLGLGAVFASWRRVR